MRVAITARRHIPHYTPLKFLNGSARIECMIKFQLNTWGIPMPVFKSPCHSWLPFLHLYPRSCDLWIRRTEFTQTTFRAHFAIRFIHLDCFSTLTIPSDHWINVVNILSYLQIIWINWNDVLLDKFWHFKHEIFLKFRWSPAAMLEWRHLHGKKTSHNFMNFPRFWHSLSTYYEKQHKLAMTQT